MREASALLAVVAISIFTAHAQAEPASPLNFGQLVLGSSIGALVGGVGGALGVYTVCIMTTPRGPWADLTCLAGAIFYGYIPGVPIGATAGAIVAGSFQKTQGNVWLALVGAALGEGVAFFVADRALRALGETPQAQALRDVLIPLAFFGVIPISAGTGAAWGYSVQK